MKELINKLSLDQPHVLISKLEQAGYACAAWRMPESEEVHFIISLSEAKRLDNFQLEELGQGFVINEYAENHPIAPYYIDADLVFKGDKLTLNPKLKASEIDAFIDQLDNLLLKRTHKKSQKKPLHSSRFEDNVNQAIKEIREGTFEKVVLSRYKDEQLPEGFSPWEFFQRICKEYQNSFCSLTFIPGKGLWIGATPELLISDDSERFKTVSLAGTKRLEDDQTLSEIAWTQKEIEEQAFVSRYVINCFKKIRLREFHEHGPKTIKAGNLAHLKTEFIVNYSEVSFDGLANQMLELLHPTSAVCGMPIELTKPWISQMEGYDRAFYSGFLGPVNFDDSVNLFVNLRCMKINNGVVRFFAGAGITEDSHPHKEFEETEMKMNILKGLL